MLYKHINRGGKKHKETETNEILQHKPSNVLRLIQDVLSPDFYNPEDKRFSLKSSEVMAIVVIFS